MMTSLSQQNILRLNQIISRTGLSRSTIYLLISEESFPKQVKLGAHSVGWIESEIDDWIALNVFNELDNVIKSFGYSLYPNSSLGLKAFKEESFLCIKKCEKPPGYCRFFTAVPPS